MSPETHVSRHRGLQKAFGLVALSFGDLGNHLFQCPEEPSFCTGQTWGVTRMHTHVHAHIRNSMFKSKTSLLPEGVCQWGSGCAIPSKWVQTLKAQQACKH